MNNMRKSDNVKAILLLLPLIAASRLPVNLPWWSFILPVILFGVFTQLMNWRVSGFAIGFLCGFIVWLGANLYYDMILNSAVLDKIGHLLSVPKLIVMLMSSMIGALVTGLAMYTGKSMVPGKELKL
jgi:hypothetical protein